jgi:ribosomal protein S18 acetylase RimI-like enzyme
MITRHTDLAKFRARVEPMLLAREAENNLLLGLLAAIAPDSGALLVEIDGAGAALRTPPFNLILSEVPPAALDALAAQLGADGERLPGVVGPRAAASHFARVWSQARGLPARVHHAMRIFENRRVIAPRPPADGGELRAARADEADLILGWVGAFNRDVGTTTPAPRALIEERVRAGDFFVWQTERAVAGMAGIARRTPHGAAVAYVYTPPELRGRGYASAAVAALTGRLHADGRLAFLFTDLANPTSNKIYQAIGYRPVGDFEEWRFD